MSLADTIFEKIREDKTILGQVIIPEWGQRVKDEETGEERLEPLVFFYPPMTGADHAWLEEKCKKKSTAEYAALSMIRMAKDADGKNIFSLEHKRELMEMDKDLLIRIFNQLSTRPEVIDQVKP